MKEYCPICTKHTLVDSQCPCGFTYLTSKICYNKKFTYNGNNYRFFSVEKNHFAGNKSLSILKRTTDSGTQVLVELEEYIPPTPDLVNKLIKYIVFI